MAPFYINGTTGISGVDGSAATPALQGTDTNTGIAFGSDVILGSTGGTERFRCDSSGRLLVGTSSSSVNTSLVLNGSSGGAGNPGIVYLQRNETAPTVDATLGQIFFANDAGNAAASIRSLRDAGTWTTGSSHPGRLVFSTTADGASSPTERMRIDNAGNVGINKTNPSGRLHIDGAVYVNNIGSGAGTNALKYDTSNGRFTYDASSARFKDNIRDTDRGLSEVLQLKPRKFEYKDSGRTDIGFIAEEVVDIIPELVTLDSEGLPEAVNYDRFVSVLTKAFQEAVAKIETLEAKVAALESA